MRPAMVWGHLAENYDHRTGPSTPEKKKTILHSVISFKSRPIKKLAEVRIINDTFDVLWNMLNTCYFNRITSRYT